MRRSWFDSWVRKIHWRRDRLPTPVFLGFPCGLLVKNSTHNVGNLGLIPGLGRSHGEGKGYPLQCSGLENFMDCIVRGVAKSRTWLNDFHYLERGPGLCPQLLESDLWVVWASYLRWMTLFTWDPGSTLVCTVMCGEGFGPCWIISTRNQMVSHLAIQRVHRLKPNKNSAHPSSGELLGLAVLHTFCPTSFLGETSIGPNSTELIHRSIPQIWKLCVWLSGTLSLVSLLLYWF